MIWGMAARSDAATGLSATSPLPAHTTHSGLFRYYPLPAGAGV
ncbi:MAG: hypothetical protein ACKO1F_05675 [Flammeovirgaceae bacterium]